MRLHGLASFLIGQLYLHHVPDLVHHAADGRRVLTLNRVLQATQSERTDGPALVLGVADLATHPFDSNL